MTSAVALGRHDRVVDRAAARTEAYARETSDREIFMARRRQLLIAGLVVAVLALAAPVLAALFSEKDGGQYVPAFSQDLPKGSLTYGE